MTSYFCVCCAHRSTDDTCTCVFSTCRRCAPRCLTHCQCPEKHARNCGEIDPELEVEGGPFATLAPANRAVTPASLPS